MLLDLSGYLWGGGFLGLVECITDVVEKGWFLMSWEFCEEVTSEVVAI